MARRPPQTRYAQSSGAKIAYQTSGTGPPDLVMRSAVIEDTWDAMGLYGTGSHHLSLSGVPVPAERLAAPFFEPARHDGPLWRIPLVTRAAMLLAAIPLGIARRALEEVTALAVRKVRGPAALSIGHDEPSLGQRALVLLGANQAVRAGTEAVDRVFRLAGADAVFTRQPLRRYFRDIHAAGQHILFSAGRDRAFAKVRLGLDQPTYLI